MARKLFALKGVPEDESDDIRALLNDNDIEYYQTPPGNWGVSVEAIWLKNDEQWQQAQNLIGEYEHARSIRIRQEYQALKAEGKQETLFSRLVYHPVRVAIYLAAFFAVLYFSLKPFVNFLND